MPSLSYPKAPSIFCVWKWRTMNCYCVTRLMSSALYEAGICSNPSVSQPILLGVFYFGCLDCSYGPSTNNSVEQHAWKYVSAYPRSLCQLEKQSIHQLLTRYTALVKKRSCHPGFCLNSHPGLLWHSRLIWIGTSFAELSDAALQKMGLFFFYKAGLFHRKPQPPVKVMLFSLLFTYSKTSREEIQHCITLAFSSKKYIQASSWGKI